jgi:hypothetical protein
LFHEVDLMVETVVGEEMLFSLPMKVLGLYLTFVTSGVTGLNPAPMVRVKISTENQEVISSYPSRSAHW